MRLHLHVTNISAKYGYFRVSEKRTSPISPSPILHNFQYSSKLLSIRSPKRGTTGESRIGRGTGTELVDERSEDSVDIGQRMQMDVSRKAQLSGELTSEGGFII